MTQTRISLENFGSSAHIFKTKTENWIGKTDRLKDVFSKPFTAAGNYFKDFVK